MIASIFSSLPVLAASAFSIGVTVFVCKLWFKAYYVHVSDVKPLQESQHIMQNQYAILAERIKHTEAQLNEAKSKLEQYEKSGGALPAIEQIKESVLTEIKNLHSNPSRLEQDQKLQEQVGFIRQHLKELRLEFSQKLQGTSIENQEISSRISQLIELNKKLSAEAAAISEVLQISQDQDGKPEKMFTLTSIKKRS